MKLWIQRLQGHSLIGLTALFLMTSMEVMGQTTYTITSTIPMCGKFVSNAATSPTALQLRTVSISGNQATFTIAKKNNSTCTSADQTFGSGAMYLREDFATNTNNVVSRTYSGGTVVQITKTLSHTSGDKSFYIDNGDPSFSIGPITVRATTLAPNIGISSALSINSSSSINVGQGVTASFTLRNSGSGAGTVSAMTVAIIKDGAYFNDFPHSPSQVINAGQSLNYSQSYLFERSGSYVLEARWLINGSWYPDPANKRTLTVTAPIVINAPNIISPSNGATIDRPYTLSWSSVANATQYDIEIYQNGTLYWNSTLTTGATSVGNINIGEAGQSYSWRVRGKNGTTLGSWSGYATYTIRYIPPPPTVSVISPNGGQFSIGQTIPISWSSTNQSQYSVGLYRAINNQQIGYIVPLTNNSSTQSTNWVVPTSFAGLLLGGESYYIMVAVVNSVGDAKLANSSTFSIKAPLSLASVSQPPNGVIYKPNDTLPVSWQSASQAKYRISLYKGSAVLGEIVAKTVGTLVNYLWTVPFSFNGQTLNGSDYRMKVEIWNSDESETKEAFSPYFGFNAYASNCATIENDPMFANGANAIWKEATVFLLQKGIVDCPSTGNTVLADKPIVRQDLAKILYIALWGGATTASITDNFPSPYTDLQNTSTGYHRFAKALLYLEYGDGISPFDRNRTHFYPLATIPRQFAIKVFLEGWRVAPTASVTAQPFNDVPLANNMVRYIDKAKALGFVQGYNGNFEPEVPLVRGDAFIILKRMLESTTVTKPSLTDLNNIANFFVPNNVTPQTMHSAPDLAQGNFNTYAKSAFNIPDIGFALSFEMEYNSYLTEMPDEWVAVEPLSKGWSHNYMAYIYHSLGEETTSSADDRYIVNWGGASMISYKTDTLQPETEGVYDQLVVSGNTATLTTPTREVYTFQRMDGGTNPFWLTSIKDRNNNTLTLNYVATPYTKNAGGRILALRNVSEVVVPSGRKLSFVYQNNKLIRVTDPINRQLGIGYDPTSGQFTTFTDAKTNVTTYGYGTNLEAYLLKSVKLPEGNVITTEYDLNRKAKSVSSNGEQTTINFQPQYNDPTTFLRSTVTEKVDGKTTTYTTEYAKNNNLKNYAGPNGHTVGLAYNHAADPTLPTTITDSRVGATTIGYNTKGNPTSSSWNGLTASITYQDEVFPREITDANGYKTTITYDGRMNPETVTDAEGYQARTTYYPNGLAHVITNPAGISTTLSYDQYGSVATVTLPEGISTQTTYDGVSRPERHTNPLGQVTTTEYDPNDNVVREEFGGAETTYGFDKNDNLRWIKDALQQTTTLNYDVLDRLREQIANGKTRSWTFLDGVLKTYTSPNGKTFINDYDTEGRFTGDGYATYGYNADGTLQSISKDGKAITFGYDAQKRPTSITYDGQTVGYTYDNNGNVLTMTYPGNKVVRYAYYRNNWLKTVTDWNNKTTIYTYYPDGRLKTEELPNGVITTYTYDTAGRNTGISIAKNGSAPIANYAFTLDKMGQHTSVTVNEPLGAEPPLSNQTQTATFANNVMASLNGSSVTHNNNGAMTQGAGLQISYDDKDMPINLNGNGLNNQYTYDGLKIRRSKTANGVITRYIVDILGMSDVLMETDANYTPKAYYVYGLGLISRIKPDGTTHYYHGDFRGSVVAITDANSTITHKYQYAPFGEITQRQEPANDSQPFLYVGKQGVQHEGNGVFFMRARYYDSATGRFLSEDPIWHANLYPYADNNPIMGIDPEGLKTIIIYTPKSYNSTSVQVKIAGKAIGKAIGKIYNINKVKNGLMPLYYTLNGKDAIDEKVKSIDSYVPQVVKEQISQWAVKSGLRNYLRKNGITYQIPKQN